jgi:predicted DNA-binding transcriptional regulator AlpA
MTYTEHKASTSLVSSKAVEGRYRISDRTLDRWLKNAKLAFPRPVVVNRRRYFDLSEIEAWEKIRRMPAAATDQSAEAA